MSDGNDQIETKGRLSLRPVNRNEGGHTVDAGSVRQRDPPQHDVARIPCLGVEHREGVELVLHPKVEKLRMRG